MGLKANTTGLTIQNERPGRHKRGVFLVERHWDLISQCGPADFSRPMERRPMLSVIGLTE